MAGGLCSGLKGEGVRGFTVVPEGEERDVMEVLTLSDKPISKMRQEATTHPSNVPI